MSKKSQSFKYTQEQGLIGFCECCLTDNQPDLCQIYFPDKDKKHKLYWACAPCRQFFSSDQYSFAQDSWSYRLRQNSKQEAQQLATTIGYNYYDTWTKPLVITVDVASYPLKPAKKEEPVASLTTPLLPQFASK